MTTAATSSLAGVSAVKLALLAQQARAQLGALARAEPIAVIGMGCRFPGGVDSPETFWAVLHDGVDAVGDIPPTRWDVPALFDPDPAVPGKIAVNAGGFIDDVDRFDASFFGILRREAERMDPQHRVFLEVATEALDHAGLSRDLLAGSATGVFIASYHSDYSLMQYADRDGIDGRTLTGTQHSVLANRLSYLLDLRGPSISIDTACSSSLVAVHLACQSLRSAETTLALAGGVSLMLAPDMMIALSKVGFMSSSGRCRTFDALADGFIRGEGCGVVVLKRLSDALADGDRVLSVIRGTAVNQDGHSTVLAAPNGLAQQALVREALANAQLTPDRVGFVETHGTATPLGDPIEVEALAATIGAPRADGGVCYLGSAKANLGHMEAAAGVAGLIKATLVLQHGEIPRQVHFTKLNPHLSLTGTCLAVADVHRAWPAGAFPRVAGISGFGVGGTNAHVLVEEAPAQDAEPPVASGEMQLLPLSAQSPDALRAVVQKWIPFLESSTSSLDVICATASERRSHYDCRLAVTGTTASEIAAQLRAHVAGEPSLAVHGRRPPSGAPSVAFVFSGQGPQWVGMGQALTDREPIFRDVLRDLDGRFRKHADWSLLAALAEPEGTSRLMETEVAQPAIFAIQVALAALWDSWGVRPDAVVGHSIGELAALHVAGVLDLDEAVRIVFHRGRIMQQATGLGRMAAVGLSAEAAERLVADIGLELSLAAVNGPTSSVLAGDPEALERALALLTARDVQSRLLPVSYAFHSSQMAPFERELVSALGSVVTHPARIAVYSTVTGARLDAAQVSAAYFGRNVRSTVRFAPAIDAMLEHTVDAFLEVAPHPVLSSAIAECATARGRELPVIASMRRGRAEREAMLQACAAVYAIGVTPRWGSISPLLDGLVDLPSYPWQRERYWLRDFARPARAVATPDPETFALEGRWPSVGLEWLGDHRIAQQVVMPGAAMLEIVRQTAAQASNGAAVHVTDFVVHDRMILKEQPDRSLSWRCMVAFEADGMQLTLLAFGGAEDDAVSGRTIATARATLANKGASSDSMRDAETIVAPGVTDGTTPSAASGWHQDVSSLYERFAALGVQFGPTFQTIDAWRVGNDTAEGWLTRRTPASDDISKAGVHPTVLDGMLQLAVLTITSADRGYPGALMLPLGVESYRVFRDVPVRVRCIVHIERAPDTEAVSAHVRLLDATGTVVAGIDGARFAPVTTAALASFRRSDPDLYSIGWRRVSGATPVAAGAASGRWIVLGDDSQLSRALSGQLQDAGGQVIRVRTGDPTAAGHDEHLVQPDDSVGLQQRLRALLDEGSGLVRGIVHAWSADVRDVADANAASEDADDLRGDWMVVGSALATVQALAKHRDTVPLWLVTQASQDADGPVGHPRHAALWGLANVVAVEHADLTCRVVDLESGDGAMQAAGLLRELVRASGNEPRVALRGDERLVPVLARYRRDGVRAIDVPGNVRLERSESGALDELRWVSAQPSEPGPGTVRVRVEVTGVNFRDVLLSLGMYPGTDGVLGAECVGLVDAVGDGVTAFARGDRVFGFAPGSMASTVVVPAAYLSRVPDRLSDEEAASAPVAFLTAMLGLYGIADIGAGTHVLIHAAAGGVGLAAVQLAQRRGAVVHATAGSPGKRDHLRSLGVPFVYDSRSLAFADEVLAATHGRGVDVVLNSLAGDFIAASVRALASGGWMLELGKRDLWTPERMRAVRPDVHYRVYDLGQTAADDPGMLRPMLETIVREFETGLLQPLPVRAFDFGHVTSAFRFMAQARHTGKLVLRAPASARPSDEPIIRADATYLITGGTGALGMRTARWLAGAGARSLVLTGRRAPGDEVVRQIDALRADGIAIHVRAVDAGDTSAMRTLFAEISRDMPALRGVVHAAGVTDDGVLLQYTWDRARAVLRGKVHGARVLDRLTEQMSLDFLILYSSIGVHLGPLGQGAYAAANAELDALASSRRGRGLPALSVAWGQWPEGGMATAMNARGTDIWSARGLGWVDPQQAFRQLETLVRDGATYAAVFPMQWDRFLSRLPAGLDSAFFRAMSGAPTVAPPATQSASDARPVSLVEQWRREPASAWPDLILAHVTRSARHVLEVDDGFPIGPHTPLKDVGLDSLMAVELRNVLTRSLGKSLPATLLFDYPSLAALVGYLQRTFGLQPDTVAPAVSEEAPRANAIAVLSDEEAERLLLAELDATDTKVRS